VVTDVGANAETLGPQLATQLVAPGSPAALAATLLATVASPQRLRAMAACGRGRVEDHYSHHKMLREYEGLYRRLSATGGVRSR
jgi:glycosyltransferase involved in cell wall biosynthesis